ncbi:MAG: alpha/beta hydrolase, partial [Thermoflexales bacterium]|nr:alpha/beta hydrolase [Thermoflexales bacterium]
EGERWTIDDLADDVAALLDELGVAQATFCGLSMGGYVAFALWRNHRQRIRRLILADTKASADTPQAKANRQRQAELVRAQGVAPLADEMVPKLLSPHNHAALSEVLRQTILRARPETVLAALPALAERPDMSEQLGEITVPTLIIVGEDDAISPISDAQLMYDRMPNAQLVIIPKAGHMSPLEEPEAFNRAVLEFMRDF